MISSSYLDRAFYSLCGLFVILVLGLAGLLSLSFYYRPSLVGQCVHFIAQQPPFLFFSGVFLFFLSFLLIVGMYRVTKKNFFQLSLKCPSVTIEEAIIRDYVDEYWKEIFPTFNITSSVIMHSKHKLEVIANLPDLPLEERKDAFQRIQNELGVILARRLGYEREFLLTITD